MDCRVQLFHRKTTTINWLTQLSLLHKIFDNAIHFIDTTPYQISNIFFPKNILHSKFMLVKEKDPAPPSKSPPNPHFLLVVSSQNIKYHRIGVDQTPIWHFRFDPRDFTIWVFCAHLGNYCCNSWRCRYDYVNSPQHLWVQWITIHRYECELHQRYTDDRVSGEGIVPLERYPL